MHTLVRLLQDAVLDPAQAPTEQPSDAGNLICPVAVSSIKRPAGTRVNL